MERKWEQEKEEIVEIQEKREQLEKFKRELEDAQNNYDLEKAAELRHGKIPAIEKGNESVGRKNSRKTKG